MWLVNTNAFGNFKPGDYVEVPDGAGFDNAYFERAEEPKPGNDAPNGAEEVSD